LVSLEFLGLIEMLFKNTSFFSNLGPKQNYITYIG
jgi:hypothetical protein